MFNSDHGHYYLCPQCGAYHQAFAGHFIELEDYCHRCGVRVPKDSAPALWTFRQSFLGWRYVYGRWEYAGRLCSPRTWLSFRFQESAPPSRASVRYSMAHSHFSQDAEHDQ